MHNRTNRHSWMLILVLVALSGWLQPLGAMAQTYGGGGPNINQATQESAHGPKARIAVAKFLDKSGKGQAAGIGSGMADMLATSLFQTGRYIVLERQNLQDVLSEQDLGASGRIRPDTAAAIGQVEGAEILVTGNITEFEAATSGGQGGLGVSGQDVTGDKRSLANKLFGSVVGKLGGAFQSSHIAIDMRLVDTRTGRVVAAASVKGEANDISGLGSAAGSGLAGDLSGYAKTPMEKAIRLAIQEAVQFVVAQTPAQYYRAPQPVAAAQQWPQQPAAGGFPGQGMPSAQQVPIPGQAGFPGQQPGFPQAQGQGGFPQQGYPQGGQPGFPQQGFPQAQGGFPPPQGQSGFPQASQPGFPPQGQPGFPQAPQGQAGFPQAQGFPPAPQGQPSFPQQPGYPQPPQAQGGFPQQGYPQGGQPGFPQQGFPQAQGGFPPPQGQSGFPQAQGFPQAPQGQPSVPQQPGYQQPTQAQGGFPQAGFPQDPSAGQQQFAAPQQAYPSAAQQGLPQQGVPQAPQQALPATQQPVYPTSASPQGAPQALPAAGVTVQPPMTELKSTFIPGEKTLFFDDFTDMSPDDAPPHFKVRGAAPQLLAGGGVRQLTARAKGSLFPNLTTLPKDFTYEAEIKVDAVKGRADSNLILISKGKQVLHWWLSVQAKQLDLIVSLRSPYQELGRKRVAVNLDQPMKVALWAQNGRMRSFVNGEKLLDFNQVDLPPIDSVEMEQSFLGAGPALGYRMVRFAESTPDFSQVISATGRYVTYGILFDTGSDRLKPESAPVIQAIARGLETNPNLQLLIEGHTDAVGDAAQNLDLSRRRAEALKTVLVVQFRVDANRLTTAGLGATRPIDSNDTPKGRAQNRRVELVKK